jgi:predicted SAM-dependent methyltransferase
MSREASKTRKIWDEEMLSRFKGEGIDIGCGDDPVLPTVDRFDRRNGDANRISEYVEKRYDFVFASHVLEHMEDPGRALREWYSLLRPGGHLIVLVPDEDLYEQGAFPSLFNDDHKHTFTISKSRSWSPTSANMFDLARSIGGEIVSLELQDHGYDRRLLKHAPGRGSRALLSLLRRIARLDRTKKSHFALTRLFMKLGAPADQTAFPDDRLAQIQLVLRKPAT